MTIKIEKRLHLKSESKGGLEAFVCTSLSGELLSLWLSKGEGTREFMSLEREQIVELREFLKLAAEYDQ